MKDFWTWEWRRLGKVAVKVEYNQRDRAERYLKWLTLVDKGMMLFKWRVRKFAWEPEQRLEPLIIGDQRDPEQSDPRIGRRRGDVVRQVGMSGLYVLAIPGSSIALQQPFARLAEITNVTQDWRISLLSIAFMVVTASVLWAALSWRALHHTDQAVALIKSGQTHRW